MSTTARVTAEMLDGTKFEATGVYMPLADRMAFERRFGHSLFRSSREDLLEEEAAFFSWCVLHRAGTLDGTFEEFTEGVERISIETLEGPVDPTDAAPPPGI